MDGKALLGNDTTEDLKENETHVCRNCGHPLIEQNLYAKCPNDTGCGTLHIWRESDDHVGYEPIF